MYDRDYVKTLEREIELSGDNRFEGWRLSPEKVNCSGNQHPQQGEDSSKNSSHE
jgi:hypothetical protein